jgi:hypothetical protein
MISKAIAQEKPEYTTAQATLNLVPKIIATIEIDSIRAKKTKELPEKE